MAYSLEQLFSQVYLTGTIQAVKTGIPDKLPPAFSSIKRQTVGDSGRYSQFRGVRKAARRVSYGAAALARELRPAEIKDVKLLHTLEQIQVNPLTLQNLRRFDSYEFQNMGKEEVARQQAEFKVYFDNLRLATTYSMLAKGAIYFNDDGNLLPTSSGAELTVSYQISANNQNQLNGLITASWATANTDIPLQLRNLRKRSAQQTGYELKYAFYGSNVPSYLSNNNYVLDYLARAPAMNAKFLSNGEVPDGLFGFTWVPVYEAFFEDSSSTNQEIFGADTVVFTPEINPEVYELLEGTYAVPSSLNVAGDMAAAMRNMRSVQGVFSYAAVTHNPPGVAMYMGDTFLPVWKVPDALYIADVTP